MEEVKVIFHIDELNKWPLLLKNVENLVNARDDEKIDVEVLANAEAVKAYDVSSDIGKQIVLFMERLENKKLRFTACNNALNGFNVKKENLIRFINIVPVGVLELVNKQKDGYAYIKP